jgi:SAM-dependent methyltransferase
MKYPSYSNTHQWPKNIPPLSPEDRKISDDFMNYWLKVLPNQFGIIEKFNHGFPAATQPDPGQKTLEIGAGRCSHVDWEPPDRHEDYYAVEYRQNIVHDARKKYPRINIVEADCQQKLPFSDGYFARILAIHVLEHLPNLPSALQEVRRLLSNTGKFIFVIPCLNSLTYKFAQRISAARIFRKRYNRDYSWFINREHINSPEEILPEIAKSFHIDQLAHFPSYLPIKHLNLCLGVICSPKQPCSLPKN